MRQKLPAHAKLKEDCRQLCIFWVRFRMLTCPFLEIKHEERPPPANNNAPQKHTQANCTPQSIQKEKVFDLQEGILHRPWASYLTHQTSHAAAGKNNRACCRRMGRSLTGWYLPHHLPLSGLGQLKTSSFFTVVSLVLKAEWSLPHAWSHCKPWQSLPRVFQGEPDEARLVDNYAKRTPLLDSAPHCLCCRNELLWLIWYIS